MRTFKFAACLLVACMFTSASFAQTHSRASALARDAAVIETSRSDAPAVEVMAAPKGNWTVEQSISAPGVYFSGSAAAERSKLGSTSDFATFVPISPCRLVDTRGVFSPVYAGGAFATNEIRNYPTVGTCGIPSSARPVAVSMQVFGILPAAVGNLELVPTGTPLGSTATLVDIPGTYTSVSAVVATSGAGGSFTAQLRLTSGDIAIDINGYYANTLPTGEYLTVSGNQPGGGVGFFVTAAPVGASINALNTNTGSQAYLAFGKYAVQMHSGELKSSGAGINTTGSPAFTLKAVAGLNMCSVTNYVAINHPTMNGNPNALAMVTPVHNPASGGFVDHTTHFALYYSASAVGGGTDCAANRWYIRDTSVTAIATGRAWHILAISP